MKCTLHYVYNCHIALCAAVHEPYQLRYGLDNNNKSNNKVRLAWKIGDFWRLTRFDAEFWLLLCKLWAFLYSHLKIGYQELPQNKLFSFSVRHLCQKIHKKGSLWCIFLDFLVFDLFVYVFDSWYKHWREILNNISDLKFVLYGLALQHW